MDPEISLLHRINLVEVLLEKARAEGQHVEEPPEDAAEAWSELEIRQHFAACRVLDIAASPAQFLGHGRIVSPAENPLPPPATRQTPADAPAGAPASPVKFHEPSAEDLAKWFPALGRTGCQSPRMRIICFHSAGNAEDMYSSEGTGIRRAPSPLLEWCREQHAELLVVQMPGRGTRMRERPCRSAREAAEALLPLLASRLAQAACRAHEPAMLAQPTGGSADPSRLAQAAGGAESQRSSGDGVEGGASSVPYVIVSHSMGCWVAYEMLMLAREAGLPMPDTWFLSAMPAPDLPEDKRPWRRQAQLDEAEFKEECRGWDINEAVFTPAMWPIYQPLLRADFRVFDEYVHAPQRNSGTLSEVGAPSVPASGSSAAGPQVELHVKAASAAARPHAGSSSGAKAARPFDFPIRAFWGLQDRRVKRPMVEGWARFTTGPFVCFAIDGNHLWPIHREAKTVWLNKIVQQLNGSLSSGSRSSDRDEDDKGGQGQADSGILTRGQAHSPTCSSTPLKPLLSGAAGLSDRGQAPAESWSGADARARGQGSKPASETLRSLSAHRRILSAVPEEDQ